MEIEEKQYSAIRRFREGALDLEVRVKEDRGYIGGRVYAAGVGAAAVLEVLFAVPILVSYVKDFGEALAHAQTDQTYWHDHLAAYGAAGLDIIRGAVSREGLVAHVRRWLRE